MSWDIEYTDEFGGCWDSLAEKEQVSVSASVDILGLFGRWYEQNVPEAEKLYDVHLKALGKEGRNHG
jgi:hypothetical protein